MYERPHGYVPRLSYIIDVTYKYYFGMINLLLFTCKLQSIVMESYHMLVKSEDDGTLNPYDEIFNILMLIISIEIILVGCRMWRKMIPIFSKSWTNLDHFIDLLS